MANHEMMIPADGRAYGVTTGLRRGFNGKAPRTTAPALTYDCIVRDRDGNVLRIIPKRTRNITQARKSHKTVIAPRHSDIALMARMGSIHD